MSIHTDPARRRTAPHPIPLLALLACAVPLGAQEVVGVGGPVAGPPAARSVALQPAAGPIQIDGSLDDAGWVGAARIDLPYEYFPGDNTEARARTECLVTYDAQNLYLACVAHDPDPSQIRANYTDRDRALQDDHVTFVLDPFGDRRRALQFRVNPLGVQMDALFTQDSEDFSWDAIWSSAGRLTPDGYVVEVAIPFRSLRFPRRAEAQSWGIIIDRVYPRTARYRMRSVPTDRSDNCLLCQASRLTGLQGIAPGRDVEISPTLTAARTDLAPAGGGALQDGRPRSDAGLNLRWGVTSNLSANATINPDFSQVEADVAQLAVNQRFALSFPEKRPFFLDGADVFQTLIPVIFTRKVVEPTVGFKLTGKEGDHALGSFATRDRVNSLILPTNQSSRSVLLNEEVTTGVVRYLHDLGQSSTLGAAYTGRVGSEYSNHVGSVDGVLRLSRTNTLRGQITGSSTAYPQELARASGQPEGSFQGTAMIGQFNHASRHWNAWGQLQHLDPGVRMDAGFLRRVDARVVRGQAQRIFWGSRDGWYNRLAVGLFAERLTRTDGVLTDEAQQLSLNYNGPMQSLVNLGAGRSRVLWNGETFDLADATAALEIQPGPAVTLRFIGRAGGEVDLANTREAAIRRGTAAADLRLGRHLKLDLMQTVQRLATPAGEEIFTENLSFARAIYNFNARMLVRGIVQYQDVRRAPDLHLAPVRPVEQRLASQLLFSYKVNPQTALFLGYSDNLLGELERDLSRENRTFFMKLGYAWRL